MTKVKLPETANVHLLETLEGKFVSFQTTQPTCSSGVIQEFEIILVIDDKLSFRLGSDQAKRLLTHLNYSIAVCEYFNFKLKLDNAE
ncbi:MAG: hypothetical protein ACOYMA_20050 [Bacteroidia bacterium]